MYTDRNFKTKKALKEAVKNKEVIRYFQPGPFGGNEPQNGKIFLEGPNFVPHTWYAECRVVDGIIVSVK